MKSDEHASTHTPLTIHAYIEATKTGIRNPIGLTRTLYRSGGEDGQITIWLADKQAEAARQAEAEARALAEADADARTYAMELIRQGGIRNSLDCSFLAFSLSHFAALPDPSEFDRTTFRQLKKILPYAISLIESNDDCTLAAADTLAALRQLQEEFHDV